MHKRGQATVLIIFGIVIALAIVIVFFSLNDSPLEGLGFDKNTENVQSSTEECFKKIYIDSLDFIGAQGGYSKEPLGPYVSEIGLFFPIYNFNGDVYLPKNELVEYELSLIIDENLPICIAQAQERYPSLEISYDNFLTTTKINKDSVSFITSGDFKITNNEGTVITEFNEININSKLNNLILASTSYTLGSDSSICLDCIADISDRFDLLIDVANFQEGIIIVNLYANEKESYPSAFTFLEVHDEEVFFEKINYLGDVSNEETSEIKELPAPPQ